MPRKTAPAAPSPLVANRVALYARVSSEEQSERGTIGAQVQFLQSFVSLYGLEIASEYLDDGISGTRYLADRPAGARLLADAEARQFGTVLVYRVDRLGRSTRALLDAHERLTACGVSIRSATEPFDTTTPIGSFLFTLLGSLAELDRSTLIERMVLGRDRVARAGVWVNGPLPPGYDLDTERRLVPSQRVLPHGETEAAFIADLFVRVAGGSTLNAERARITALGVPCETRWPNRPPKVQARWWPTKLHKILTATVYRGVHTRRSRYGSVETAVPPLVSDEVWHAAQAALTRNRALSLRPGDRAYLLRGLLVCAGCGRGYTGHPSSNRRPDGTRQAYYRCNGMSSHHVAPDRPRCPGRVVPVDDLDRHIWARVRRFVLNPDRELQQASDTLATQTATIQTAERERARLGAALREKAAERERVQLLFRRGAASLDDTERALAEIASEERLLGELLAAMAAQTATVEATAVHLSTTRRMLAQLRDAVERGDGGDLAAQREVIERVVTRVDLVTEGTGREKSVRAVLRYTFDPCGSIPEQCCYGMLPHAETIPVRL